MTPPRFMRSSRSHHARRSGGNSHRSAESHGPNGKVRGNYKHILDHYLSQARDARASGDRVMVEYLLQYAEHYQRMVNQINETMNNQQQHGGQPSAATAPQDHQNSVQDRRDEQPRDERREVTREKQPRDERHARDGRNGTGASPVVRPGSVF